MSKARELAELGDTLTVDGSGNIDITGTVTADGLTVDGATTGGVRIRAADNLETTFPLVIENSADSLDLGIGAYGLDNTIGVSTNSDFKMNSGRDIIMRSDGKTYFKMGTGGDISFYEDIGVTPKFHWDASAERLGLGTTSPFGILHLQSTAPTVVITDSDGAGVQASGSISFRDSANAQLTSIGLFSSGNSDLDIFQHQAANIDFSTNSQFAMRIDSSGNVGIGTTTGDYRLAIKDSGVDIALINQNDKVWTIGQNVVIDEFSIRDASLGATRLHIDSSGNVGINTTSPSEALTVIGSGVFGDTTTKYNTVTINGGHVGDGDNDYGLTINAFEPAITFLDRSTGAGSGQMRIQSNGAFHLLADTTNDGTIGHSGNTTDFVMAKFEPTQHTFNVNSGATEAMRIASSGNVGIGTSSPEESLTVAGGAIQLKGNTYTDFSDYWGSGDNTAIFTPYGYLGSNGSFAVSLFSNGYRNSGGGFTSMGNGGLSTASGIELAPSGVIQFRTGTPSGTSVPERMRIDSSGRVGINTSSPSNLLDVEGASGSIAAMRVANPDVGLKLSAYTNSFAEIRVETNHPLVFKTNGNSEKMRIDSSGNLLVGTSSAFTSNGKIQVPVDSSTDGAWVSNSGSSLSRLHMRFENINGLVGSIGTSGSSTSYNTSSDYRLKTDAQPMTGASARVQALKPVNFAWITDGTRVDGFLAHEAQEVVPEAVTGTKDAMRDEEYEVTPAVLDEEGNVVTEAVMGTRSVPDYQGIDQSKLVPLLTAALQEALNKIDALETRITALEG